MAPTRTPVVPDQPITIPDNTPLFGTDLESGAAYNEKPGSHNFEFDAVPPGAGCNLPEGAGQIILETGFPAAVQLAPRLNQPQLASALNVPFPTLHSPVDAPVPEEGISDLFTPEIQYWEEDILAWAVDFEMDPNLIAAVMQIESCGYSRAKSAAGAMGLFQVMPHHFKNREDPYDPDTNAYRGLSWLQQTLRSGGSTAMALASYNAGIARAKNPHLDWPAETRRYVFWGINLYQDAADGYETSYALDNWLSKGGSALCSRAAAEQQDP
jgi:soluble lytic murein transglycosylase-like protein